MPRLVVGEQPSYPVVFVSDGTTMVTISQAESGMECAQFDRHRNTGLHHLALREKGMESLRRAYEKAAAFEGVKVEFAPEPLGSTSITHFMIYEPGGCRLEFDCRPPPERQQTPSQSGEPSETRLCDA